jgi:hypothetical protein
MLLGEAELLQNPAIIISALLLLWRWLYYNPLLHPLFLLYKASREAP